MTTLFVRPFGAPLFTNNTPSNFESFEAIGTRATVEVEPFLQFRALIQ